MAFRLTAGGTGRQPVGRTEAGPQIERSPGAICPNQVTYRTQVMKVVASKDGCHIAMLVPSMEGKS